MQHKVKMSQLHCTSTIADLETGLPIRVLLENCFLYFSSKTYVVGTQKNRLNETVLLSTQNTCLNCWVRK